MLEVVIGNRLRDVSRAVISKIDISDNLEPENFIIVPDRFSLLAEKMILEELVISSTFNIQVVGISQLAQIVLEKNKVEINVLSSNECKLIILNILKRCENLSSFKSISLTLADEIYKIISQLKSNNISYEKFFDSIKEKNDEKLEDIAKIYEIYQADLGQRIDQSDLLTRFVDVIKENEYNYFFVEFDSLTEQGGLILEKLIKYSKRVVVGVTRPEFQKNSYLYDNDILYKLSKICKDNKISAKRSYVKNNTDEVQNHILKNLYGFSPAKIENKNLYLLNFSTQENEIESVAKIISFEIKNNNKHFRDFNILTSNVNEKQNIFEKIFAEYNIPFFIDSGMSAEELKPVQFLNLIFKFLLEDKKENFIALTKNFYSQIDFSANCDIENYINKIGQYDLNYFKNEDFSGNTNKFAQNLLKIKEKFKNCDKNTDFINLINDFIIDFEIEKLTQDLIIDFQNKKELKLEKIYQQIYKKIIDILEVIKNNLKEELQFKELIEVFNSLLNDKEIFSIPASVDCVYIGDAVKSYFEERDILFVVGASQNSLPVVLKDYSILSDNDIENLSVSINPTIKMINKRNKFKLFQNLTLAKEIIISYSSTALGEKVEPSSLINEMQKIFIREGKEILIVGSFFDEIAKDELKNNISYLDIQNNIDYEREILNLIDNKITVGQLKDVTDFNISFLSEDLKKYLGNIQPDKECKVAISEFFSSEEKEKIDNASEVYFSKNKISASQIERFYECPFKHFFTFGLKLKENEICKFDGRDVGNYFHILSENFVKRNLEKLSKMSSLEIEEELENISKIIYGEERFSRLANCLENKHMIAKLRNEAKMLLNQINYEQKWTDFVVKFVEKGFKYPIKTDFKLTGFVDRVDTSGEYFRVIDYKSGEVEQSLAGVYCGIELQLFIYMIAMQSELGLKSAGGLYFPVGSDFANNKALKKLVLSGFILGDSAIIKKFDRRLSNNILNSDIVAIKLSSKSESDNLVYTNRKNMFSEKELNATLEYVKLLINKAINEISTGNIFATPMKSKNKIPCMNCPFYSICSFKGEENSGVPREVPKNISENSFVNILEGRKDV